MDDAAPDPLRRTASAEPADALDRDDRGPGPLPEPRDYDLPAAPVVDR